MFFLHCDSAAKNKILYNIKRIYMFCIFFCSCGCNATTLFAAIKHIKFNNRQPVTHILYKVKLLVSDRLIQTKTRYWFTIIPYCLYTDTDVYLIELFTNITDYQISYVVNKRKMPSERAENNKEDNQKKELYDIYGIGETTEWEQFWNAQVNVKVKQLSSRLKTRQISWTPRLQKLKHLWYDLSSLQYPNILTVHQSLSHG